MLLGQRPLVGRNPETSRPGSPRHQEHIRIESLESIWEEDPHRTQGHLGLNDPLDVVCMPVVSCDGCGQGQTRPTMARLSFHGGWLA